MNPTKRAQKLEQSRQAHAAGDSAEAERFCQVLLRANPADAQALHVLGVVAASRGESLQAIGYLSRCSTIDPRNARYHQDLGRLQALAGRYTPALASLQRALVLAPGDRLVTTDLADVLERSAQHERALGLLEPWLRGGTVSEDMAPVAMRLLDRAGQTAQAIDLGRRLLTAAPASDASRRFLLQLLGRLYDKTGDADAAFEAFAAAKRSERHTFVPAHHAREIDALIEVFSRPALQRLPRAADRSDLPVFIACMPRSGSTLVEQVIHAHPLAHGAGESSLLHKAAVALPSMLGNGQPYPQGVTGLDQHTTDRLAASYLRAIAAPAQGAERITNKHLLNYLHLGLVALLFPGARVIHIQRDPMDNGLACFMTSLAPAVMPWASELHHIGFAFRHYERLMAHWREALDLKLLELRYEDLVTDSATQIRRIVDFCGLPWDDRCLRFWEADRVVLTPSYDQVRQPIFATAVDRWRRYEAHLGPLRQALI